MHARAFLAIVVAVATLLAPVSAVHPGAGRADASPIHADAAPRIIGQVEDNSYRAPTHGWRLTWDAAVWQASQEFTIDQGSEGLVLDSPTSQFTIYSVVLFGGDDKACLRAEKERLAAQPGVSDVKTAKNLARPKTAKGVRSALYRYRFDFASGEVAQGVEYFECRRLVAGKSVLAVNLTVREEVYEGELASYEAILAALKLPKQKKDGGTKSKPTPTPTVPTEPGLHGNSYLHPLDGWSITWDETVWEVKESAPGLDLGIRLTTVKPNGDTTFVDINAVPDVTDRGPRRCVEESRGVISGRDDVSEFEDATDLPRPQTTGDGYAELYRYRETPRSGESFLVAHYVECRPLPGTGDVLMILLRAYLDQYEAVLPLVNDLFATLSVPTEDEGDGGEGKPTEPPDDGQVDAQTADYLSPTYGWQLTWDAVLWEATEQTSTAEGDTLQLETLVNTVLFTATDRFGDRPKACLQAVVASLKDDAAVVRFSRAEGVAPGPVGPDVGQLHDTYDVTYRDGDDTVTLRVYLECRTLIASQSVLSVVWVVAADYYEGELGRVGDLLARIQIPGQPVDEEGPSHLPSVEVAPRRFLVGGRED